MKWRALHSLPGSGGMGMGVGLGLGGGINNKTKYDGDHDTGTGTNNKNNDHGGVGDLPRDVHEFETIGTLGKGTFGHVVLVRDPIQRKRTYALKIITKEAVVRGNQQVTHRGNGVYNLFISIIQK
jgi:hypothetical protein